MARKTLKIETQCYPGKPFLDGGIAMFYGDYIFFLQGIIIRRKRGDTPPGGDFLNWIVDEIGVE